MRKLILVCSYSSGTTASYCCGTILATSGSYSLHFCIMGQLKLIVVLTEVTRVLFLVSLICC